MSFPRRSRRAYSSTVQADPSGVFTITNAVAGTYTVTAKGSNTLANAKTNAALHTGINDLYLCRLVPGDADDDNQITIADFSILAAAFGSSQGKARWDPRADFDRSAQVNITDFSMISSSFGSAGNVVCNG